MAPPACTAGRARRARRALERWYYIGSCASTWLELFGASSGSLERGKESLSASTPVNADDAKNSSPAARAVLGPRGAASSCIRFKLCLKRSRINHAAPEHHQPADRFSGPGPPFVHRLQKKTPKTRKPLQPLPFGSGSSVASVRPPASPTLFSPSEALFSPPTPGQPRHTGITPALAQLSLDSPRGPLFKIESNASTDLFQFEFKMPKVPKVMRAAGIAAASLLVLAATYLLVAPSPSLPPAPPPIHRIAPPKAFGRVSLEARLAATSEALAHLAEPPTAPMPLPPTLNAIPLRNHMGEDVRSVLLQSHTSPFVFHGPAAPAVPMRLHQGEDVRSILLQAAAEASAKAHIAIAAAKKTVVVEKEEVVAPAVEEAMEEAVAEEQPVIFDFAADAAADSWRAARLASRIEIHRSAVFMESAINGWPVYLGPPRIAQMPSCPAKCHLMPPPWANSTYLLERAEADLVHEEAITHAYHTPTAMSTATTASSMPMTIAQPLQSLYSLLPPATTTTTFTTMSTFIIIEQPILAANPSSLLLVLRDLGSRLPSPPSMSLVQRPSGRSPSPSPSTGWIVQPTAPSRRSTLPRRVRSSRRSHRLMAM